MSRRRPAKPEKKLVAGREANPRNGWLAADMRVALDVLDPGGHRLVRLERTHDESDPRGVTWDGDSIGPTTAAYFRDDPKGEPEWMEFGCKTCRDLGRDDFWTELPIDAAVWRLDQLIKAHPDTPKIGTVVTVPITSPTL